MRGGRRPTGRVPAGSASSASAASIPSGRRPPRAFEDLRTPEDEPIPPGTLAELRRDVERRRLISDQIRQIEDAHLESLTGFVRGGLWSLGRGRFCGSASATNLTNAHS